jgi:GT2 family glycosyltransferase
MDEVDLFIVHWNQPAACCATVRAFEAQRVQLRITIIDNNSEAELFDQLASDLPASVRLVRLRENKGWGGAINIVLRQWLSDTTVPYCLISAHDAIPGVGCLELLLRAADTDPRIGIASPQYPEPIITKLSPLHGVYTQRVTPGCRGDVREMDVPHGTLMLLRRECLAEVGCFDERYFAYGDEHDLGARAVRKGWKVVIVWGAMVTNPATSVENKWRSYLFARNSLLLVHDYFGRFAAALRALLILVNTLRLSLSPQGNDFAFCAQARRKAVLDYFRGRTGRPLLP